MNQDDAMSSKLIIVILTTFSLNVCTTMRPMETDDSRLGDQLESQDHLVVYEKSGRIIDMTFTESDDEAIYGVLSNDPRTLVEVDLGDIERIEVEKIDGVKTTFAIVGGTIVIVPLAVIAVLTGAMFQQ